MIIAMTGVSGSMGGEALAQTIELAFVEKIRVLLTPKKRNDKLARSLKRKYGERIEVVRGWLSDAETCTKLVEKADLVINMAAVIPPRSDKDPRAS